ncbi:MAG: prepilin-type N-terminal cleavage/methylation domain-containing protein [Candidatus Staskawiczbacteria bacterium]
MVSKFFKDIKIYNKGITLIELLVVIFIIAMFSLMAISDFPRILRDSALSKITHKLSQDLRSVQDMSLSGVLEKDSDDCVLPAKGYGVYFTMNNAGQYLIYADVNGDKEYNDDFSYTECSNMQYYYAGCADRLPGTDYDCVLKVISIIEDNASLSIKQITNSVSANYSTTSVNFSPPNPTTTLTADSSNPSDIIVIFKNTDNSERRVIVNTSGLINVP